MKILKQIWSFLTRLFAKADKLVDRIAPPAIKIVNILKSVNESFTGDLIETLITKLIPGSADDVFIKALREKLRVVLPRIISALNISKSIAEIEDKNEQLKAIIVAINLSSDEAKNAYYHSLCSMIIEALSDGKLSWSESVQIAEYYYTNLYKK